MEEKIISNNREPDILKLSNELTYRRYLFNKDQAGNFSHNVNIPEYIALHIMKETGELETIYAGKTYLKDLAEKMQLSIRQTSRMVKNLQERGFLNWSHDGNGSEGTYVTITESGKKLLENQEKILKDYYGKVIEKYGKENLLQLLHLMKQLETVMKSELEDMKVEDKADDSIE